ncbi:MAG TPA: hypothetical protein VNO32_47510, partial [Candidatus Acidoferrum sp.]|nr:hypothetical protein [Candidatus Acidoferrum sp.]
TARNTFTVSYVGNAGKKLLYPYSASPTTNPDFPDGFTLIENAASSSYQALQVQDHGEIIRGMQVIASYSWSHAEDNGSTDNGYGGNGDEGTGATTLVGPQWGNSDNDIAQVFNLALNYRIPGGPGDRVIRALTTGWLLATRFSAQSGVPFSVVQSINELPATTVQYVDFPDLLPGVPVYLHGVSGVTRGWEVNPAAFSAVPVDPTTGLPERPGTSFRNEFHGPAFWGLNFSTQREFPIYERLNLTFRVDAFNIFNHANLGYVSNMFSSGNAQFGQVIPYYLTSIGASNPLYAFGAARSLQLSLKLSF